MVFSSMTFLWIFLPCVLLIYYAFSFIRNKRKEILCKNIVLMIASLIFYAWGSIKYLLIMIASILGNYVFARLINREEEKQKFKAKKTFFILALIYNLAILFFFKYFNFVVSIIENIANANFGLREVVLPIGISFFTFQSISYVIDVYLKKVKCQKNLLIVTLYISFFPQLVAGPIVRYIDIESQLIDRQETTDKFAEGIKRFVIGLGKKVIISNTLGRIAALIFDTEFSFIGTKCAWIGIIFYTLQIYYDFSGYSDMAIGLGKMFGFDFCENFNLPYISTSIQEFWRRWHISLSVWFREYIYIPLGGNRKGLPRTLLNLFIIFLLTGIWHGANYTFILWGVIFGIFSIIERLFLGKLLKKNKFKLLNWLYTMFVVMMLWVLFRANSLGDAFTYFERLFVYSEELIPILPKIGIIEWTVMGIGILFAGPIPMLYNKFFKKYNETIVVQILSIICLIIVFSVSIIFLINSTYNPFIYFQF